MTPPPGADADRIRASAERRGILLYHYTAIDNLPSILGVGALLSRSEMQARGITYIGHGWGRAGKDEELRDYICCGFRPNWGMLRREVAPQAVLQLMPRLLWRAGTLFCRGNSASNEFDLAGLLESATLIAFEAMFDSPYSNFPVPYDCEALVYRVISMRNLIRVHFQTEAHLERGRELINGATIADVLKPTLPIRIAVTPNLYPPR